MSGYASNTDAPIPRTREAIDGLLRRWRADAIQWTDEFSADRATLRFIWKHDEQAYRARFTIALPDMAKMKKQAQHKQTHLLSEMKLRKVVERRGRQEHRILLLWLTAAFNAVSAGIIDAESLFMPFFETPDGRTLAELMRPQLDKVADTRLLPSGGT